jgi:hypothetical protein
MMETISDSGNILTINMDDVKEETAVVNHKNDSKKRKMQTSDPLDDVIRKASTTLDFMCAKQERVAPQDSFTIFGNFVASEMRQMSDEKKMKKLKRTIQLAILDAQGDDEE